MRRSFVVIVAAAVAGAFCFGVTGVNACTDFQITAEDGAVIIGRSMEFGQPFDSNIAAYPRGSQFTSTAPDGTPGLSWTTKYGFVGVTAFGRDGITDGMNEKGLSVGFLWLPGTEYQTVAEGEAARAVAITELGAWMMGNFATADEVRSSLKDIVVWAAEVPELKLIPPLHVAVHDAGGKNIVIEFIGGEVKFYDNPIGVMTNAPTFDWHLENLRNYVNITSYNSKPFTMEGVEIKPTGHGSGFFGIPGDWTPPSRFIRAAMFIHLADPVKTAADGVNLAEHILNTVDIPYGNIKEEVSGRTVSDYTQWTVIKDLTNRAFYFRTYDNLTLRLVDMAKLDLAPGGAVTYLPIDSHEFEIVDVTDKLQ